MRGKGRRNCTSNTFFFLLHFSLCKCTPFPQLQKSKEREERLEDVIQAYEKIHMEKSNVQRDLDKMVRNSRKQCPHLDTMSCTGRVMREGTVLWAKAL